MVQKNSFNLETIAANFQNLSNSQAFNLYCTSKSHTGAVTAIITTLKKLQVYIFYYKSR